jgi:hypothetical protein
MSYVSAVGNVGFNFGGATSAPTSATVAAAWAAVTAAVKVKDAANIKMNMASRYMNTAQGRITYTAAQKAYNTANAYYKTVLDRYNLIKAEYEKSKAATAPIAPSTGSSQIRSFGLGTKAPPVVPEKPRAPAPEVYEAATKEPVAPTATTETPSFFASNKLYIIGAAAVAGYFLFFRKK